MEKLLMQKEVTQFVTELTPDHIYQKIQTMWTSVSLFSISISIYYIQINICLYSMCSYTIHTNVVKLC